eukprot:CAMPEP_0170805276 /NCGR_PEP_ID=MMETSP0733-20121128/31279_1 /TAXON_ID=186038 /ORGANISM="Fragilariopsis kerguelensis, Strain L26-C5" /LENGTH=135 /DNA_ID=CAMNT_0011159637 /DNA_START=101 /DNA_END=509 /DNA_ORIENTATION=+
MPTEHTHFKNATRVRDSTSTDETVVIGKGCTYQRPLLIVACSLLASLVLIAVAGPNGGQHLQLSTNEITEGAKALADYQVDSANLALTKDIYGLAANSENDKVVAPTFAIASPFASASAVSAVNATAAANKLGPM